MKLTPTQYLGSLLLPLVFLSTPTSAQEQVKIGLVAALSGDSALSGESITRGMTVAIDEINAKGGVLGGKKLVLVRRDDESNPAKGQLAARELIEKEKVAVVFGGIDTPVSMSLINVMSELKTPYMGVWAAGTGITNNNKNPNYMFRVSAVDERVDAGMLKYAQDKFKSKRPGSMLVNNPWGDSNMKGLEKAAAALNITLAGQEKYNVNDIDTTAQLTRLKNAGADSIILVGNTGVAAQVMKSMERMNWNVPVVSHWGISGGRFDELAGPRYKDVVFVQTYSFFGKQSPVGDKVIAELKKRYPEIKGVNDIVAPVGTANAYDATMLTALAINKAGSTNGEKIREAYYDLPEYKGLIKTYKKPFSAESQDALTDRDYIWVHFVGNAAVPVN
ncbi:ABC transporter substrate-binding protein [Polynucleobacter sp. AP-Nino-20-G2]|uniref:ABC transporter substrate-binding protein n=1 Tax=Polynucleobacter sp. AP-Nino-20-G2 TaxID=2576917 RepID=UPI001BFCE802|nr:ABC transporter substrate-binding protein [Polynucleobacter sp. AP-Nino-20-G2]QWE16290.1 ABC transporter substrate-binding protein [Polynucleobacter sp. AP-Nino-20-G2]